MQEVLETLLIITVPTAFVLAGLLSKNYVKEIWWSKLLIILGITLLILVFLVRLQA
jgi:hypothetical protein